MKKRNFPICLALITLLALVLDLSAADGPRERLLMNFGWKFHKGDLPVNHWGKYAKSGTYGSEPGVGLAYDDSSWRVIDLPHDFTVEAFNLGANFGSGYFPSEVGWYRRKFHLPAEDKGKRITVEFGGAFQTTTFYCNNFIVGKSDSGYAPFQFDITEMVNYGGENVLSVSVDNRLPEGWWYEGGGIYRDVHLVKTSEVHIPWGGVYVQSWFKVDPEQGKSFFEDEPVGPASLRIHVTAANDGSSAVQVGVKVKVLDPSGRQVAVGDGNVKLRTRGEQEALIETKLKKPQLWSLETPHLYTAVVELECAGKVVDRFEQTFGVRTIRFDAKEGFFLNGKAVKIKGASNHQDHAGLGVALPEAVVAFRLNRLKEFGFNGYRTAHHAGGPVARVADRLGMLVFTENRKFSTGENSFKELKRMVLADRNSPSVVLWGIGNEEVAVQGTPVGGQVARGMRDMVRSLDPTRPVTMGQNEHHDLPDAAPTELDIVGFNYTCNYQPEHLQKVFAIHQDKPLVETEMANTYTSRGVYENQEALGRLLSYDVRNFWVGTFTMTEVKRLLERPRMTGGFIWTGFDYRGEPSPFFPENWKRANMPGEMPRVVSCHFGIFDLCGFPKDAAYFYKAAYSDEPVLHLFPHWNWQGKEGQPIDLWVYSNHEEVELLVNGKSFGRKPMPKFGYLSWKVPYAAGTIEAVAYKGAAEVERTKYETTGAPVAVAFESARLTLNADCEDVAMITMKVVDSLGRAVPDATNKVHFRIEGPAHLLGSGNGDAATKEPDKVPERSLWAGLAQVLVQAKGQAGEATLIGESQGLRNGVFKLKLVEAERRPYIPSPVKSDNAMWWDGQAAKAAAAPRAAVTEQQTDYSFYEKNAVTNPDHEKKKEKAEPAK